MQVAERPDGIVEEHDSMARDEQIGAIALPLPDRGIAEFERDVGKVGTALPRRCDEFFADVYSDDLRMGMPSAQRQWQFTCAATDIDGAFEAMGAGTG